MSDLIHTRAHIMYSDEKIIEALEKTGGNQAAAARAIGCSRKTVWERIQKSEAVKEAYDSTNEVNLDRAENELMDLVEGGYFKAIKFYLRTKGRKRGFGDRMELDGDINSKITVEFVDSED